MKLGFKDDFVNTSAVYPLHTGTINYLNRNKPSFLNRHSDLMGAIVTLILAIVSGILTLRNYRKARKKDNIDVYYKKLEEIRQQIPSTTNSSHIKNWQNEIRSLESETVNLIIDEKLGANESYIVYMNMVSLVKKELEQALESTG